MQKQEQFTISDECISELTELAMRIEIASHTDDEAAAWIDELRALGMLDAHVNYVGGAYVPSPAMTDLLTRGRLIAERLWPAKTEPCAAPEEEKEGI